MNYNTNEDNSKSPVFIYRPYYRPAKKKMHPVSIALRVILAAVIIAAVIIFACRAEDVYAKGWILCEDYVQIRQWASRDATSIGQLDPGDEIEIDGKTENGWAHIVSPCDGWVHAGYITFSEPEKVGDWMSVNAKKRVACRRWAQGPQIEDNGRKRWLVNGSEVQVLWMSKEWAVTSRGYIESEWLEVAAQ